MSLKNGNDYSAEYDRSENSPFFINGKPMNVELIKDFGNNIYSFIVNQKLSHIELELKPHGPGYISMDGFTHEIDITDDTKRLLQQFIKNSGLSGADAAGMIAAPMPGMVVKILTEEGDMVNQGDKVIIVEAMKMENALSAPISGIVKKIYVKEEQPVDKDTPLMEIEAAL
jgi:acetyl/propionyl-CoA carboxylase alpha subunit